MADDKRKLTEKELKRKNDFEKISSEMQQKGYKIKNMTINIRQANFLGPLSMLPFIALTFLFYYNLNGFDLDSLSLGFIAVLLVLILCLSILHELIHGITWSLFAKNHFQSIDLPHQVYFLLCPLHFFAFSFLSLFLFYFYIFIYIIKSVD